MTGVQTCALPISDWRIQAAGPDGSGLREMIPGPDVGAPAAQVLGGLTSLEQPPLSVVQAVVGATLFLIAQNYLQPLMAAASAAMSGVPMLARLFHPDRWLLFLGLAFVLSVYFFPSGLIGKLRGTRGA